MRKFSVLASVVLILISTGTGSARVNPGAPQRVRAVRVPDAGQPETPVRMEKSAADTVDFGFYRDSMGVKYAQLGGTWTWDHGAADPLEGWTSVDLTAQIGTFFRQMTQARWAAEQNPLPAPTMNGAGFALCGARRGQADSLAWLSGAGYGNNFCQRLTSPAYTYDGSGSVDLSFYYFNQSEPGFDYTYVYIEAGASRYDVTQSAFTGDINIDGGTGLITPGQFAYAVTNSDFGGGSASRPFNVVVEFVSDGGWSDEDGGVNTWYGPFGMDDFSIGPTNLDPPALHTYDFETDLQGWTPGVCPGVGSYMGVADVSAYTILDPGPCALSGNVVKMHNAEGLHPDGQHERLYSPIVDREHDIPGSTYLEYNRIFTDFDQYADLPTENGVFYRCGYTYYPYENPIVPGMSIWSPRVGNSTFYYTGGTPVCAAQGTRGTVGTDWGLPADCKQLKFIYELYSSCASVPNCSGTTNSSPLIDNVRVRNVRAGTPAPPNMIQAFSPALGEVHAVFDCDVTAATAQNVLNYTLGSLGTVNGAVLSGTREVILSVTSDLQAEDIETLTVNGIAAAASGLVMTTPETIAFVTQMPPCHDFTKTYTTQADFTDGVLQGVITNGDQLELPNGAAGASAAFPFAWIANSGDGTVSKVDVMTGNEVGRYYTGPPDQDGLYGYLSPSRTVVDKDGNCWVANRGIHTRGSVTKILAEGGIDHNSLPGIQTSHDLSGEGIIQPDEMYPWGEDERVVKYYQVGDNYPLPRALAIDKAGFLWVGLYNESRVVKLDPDLPGYVPGTGVFPPPTLLASVPLTSGSVTIPPYGLALSPSGLLYGTSLSGFAFEVDPGLASGGTAAGPAMTKYIDHEGQNYGIAVDKHCIVWIAEYIPPANSTAGCVRWDPAATTSPSTGFVHSTGDAPGPGRGITIDGNGDVWMACNDNANSVVRFSPTAAPSAGPAYPTGLATPVGIGIASDGNLIVSGKDSDHWVKLNVNTGAIIPLTGPRIVGLEPYSYSDFTGNLANIAGTQQGSWTVTTDGLYPGFKWTQILWSANTTPLLTGLVVDARAANTLGDLALQGWPTLPGSGPLSPKLHGRYLETRVRLTRTISGCDPPFLTPVLEDLTVVGVCDSCSLLGCRDIVAPCTFPAGAYVSWPAPVVSGPCPPSIPVTCTPASGSLFPIGVTTVKCFAVAPVGIPVSSSFTVTVTGNCGQLPVGACCRPRGCTVMTESACDLAGGVYRGDGTDCTTGCPSACTAPPGGMRGWWPMDPATGGKTPNLADAGAPGILIGTPTLTPGEKVGTSYAFDGIFQFLLVPDGPTLQIGSGGLSIDAWVKTTKNAGIDPIMDKRQVGPAPETGFFFFLQDGYAALELAVGGVPWYYFLSGIDGGAPAFVADGQWHHVGVTVLRNFATGLRFYVDGVQIGSKFDPRPCQGDLNTSTHLLIGGAYSGSAFFLGSLDEVELFSRALPAGDMQRIHDASTAGKCREDCYVPSYISCCRGFATFNFTLCNYSGESHTYSWGAAPSPGPNGCNSTSLQSFNPNVGTLTVPSGECANVAVSILCPSELAVGGSACFQISVFNHDTGRTFGCIGTIHNPGLWCINLHDAVGGVFGVYTLGQLQPGTLTIDVSHIGILASPEYFKYRLRAVAGDEDSTSMAIRINGLAPGEVVVDSVEVPANTGTASIPVELAYDSLQPIGFDRVLIEADDDHSGVLRPIGEIALRNLVPASTPDLEGVGPEPGATNGLTFTTLPNPFSKALRITFALPVAESGVSVMLYDVGGRTIRELLHEAPLAAGSHTIEWDGQDGQGKLVPAGIYFLQVKTEHATRTVKIARTQ